jgi:RHS repeat-associated protein
LSYAKIYLDGELKQAQYQYNARTVNYALDNAGNRTSVNDNVNGYTTYTPNSSNQYTGTAGGAAISNGSEHQISTYNNVTYSYINDEHLTQVSDGTNTYNLTYDAFGRCVKRSLTVGNNTTTTYYIYDGEKPILEYDGNGGRIGYNLYGKGIDEILRRGAKGADSQWHWYFFEQDHEGSILHLADATGTIIERYRYDAFGAPTVYGRYYDFRASTIYDNRFLFAGREYAATYRGIYNVPAFSFYEYRARAYNPQLGRFMSEDPKLFDAGDYNLFRYCHNDPIDHTDPMGTVTDTRQEDPWYTHSQQAEALDKLAATRELLGLSSTYIRAALSAQEGLTMGHASQAEGNMYSYSLKSQYKIGDLSGSRGYKYVWDPDPNCSGECMTTVQHLSGAPSSKTPLLRGNPVGPNTKQGTAIATGFEPRNGQWVYPSRPAKESNNHAAFYVAPLGRSLMQTLEAQLGQPIHLWRQPLDGWYEISSRLPPHAISTSQLRPWDGPIPW